MPRRTPSDPAVVDLLERWLDAAKRGELQEVFCLARDDRGEWTEESVTDDIGEMALEMRSSVIRLQTWAAAEVTQH